jgi:hypothetical protein
MKAGLKAWESFRHYGGRKPYTGAEDIAISTFGENHRPRTTIQMMFLLLTFVSMYIARKVGWLLSRVFYRAGWITLLFTLPIWGGIVATALRVLIDVHHPGIVSKILGYGAASYVSIPNYNLRPNDLPAELLQKHLAIFFTPLFAFVVISVMLAF